MGLGRPPKDPLRPLTVAERAALEQLARATSERADRVTRAKLLLAVADGASFTAAAQRMGRRHRNAVAELVTRFNREGLAAVTPRSGGGPPVQYGAAERARIVAEFHRPPDREQDGTATWSLTTLQRSLRDAPDGLPQISTFTILHSIHEAGYTWQQNRTWCQTGITLHKGKHGVEERHDPYTQEKKR